MASYTLIGNFDAYDTVMTIAPAYVKVGKYPCRVQLDSEIMYITGAERHETAISVNRGMDGTAQAAHTTGATLTDTPVPAT